MKEKKEETKTNVIEVPKSNGRGRPKNSHSLKVQNLDLEQVKYLSSLNLSIQKICSCLGISLTWYYHLIEERPEIKQAIEDGRALGVKRVAEALQKTAEKGNVTAQIFFLKNADPEQWNKESTTVHNNVTVNGVEDLSDNDLTQEIKKLEKEIQKDHE